MSISEKDDERQSFRSKGIPVIFQDELDEKPDPGKYFIYLFIYFLHKFKKKHSGITYECKFKIFKIANEFIIKRLI